MSGSLVGYAIGVHRDSEHELLERLSEQQIRLLKLVADGVTASKQLARVTGLRPTSIDTYLQAAARILGAENRAVAAQRLADLEARKSQPRSQLRTQGFAQTPVSGSHLVASAIRRLLTGPPLGGEGHELSWAQVGLEIIRVGLLGMVGIFALVLLVLGFLRTFR